MLVLALEVQERNGFDLALLQRNLGTATAGAGASTSSLRGLSWHDLTLVHGERADNVGVQLLDLELSRLGDAVLLADELVDTLEIVLDLGAVAVF